MNSINNQNDNKSTVKLEQGNPFYGRKKLVDAIRIAMAAVMTCAPVLPALAGPQGGVVVGGSGTISTPDAQTTVVDQHSQKLNLTWKTFDVAPSELVQFNQPGSRAVAINRILGNDPSVILGQLKANGQVVLINGNGVVFGQGSRVNVGSLVASGMAVKADDLGNKLELEATADAGGAVINQGVINASSGNVVLAGKTVSNDGVIIAKSGEVQLAAGKTATVDFDGDGLVRFAVDGDAENTTGASVAVNNSGSISAENVLMTASAAQDVFSKVVNNEGVIKAGKIDKSGGTIRLVAETGNTVNSGTLDASSSVAQGGRVEVLGDKVTLAAGSVTDASGHTGGGTILVGGDYQGGGTIQTAEQTVVESGASLKADAGDLGDGGKVVVWADGATHYSGSLSAHGGERGGNGGDAEISGKQFLNLASTLVNLSAAYGEYGTLLLDPTNIIIGSVADRNDDGTLGDDVTGNINSGAPGVNSQITAAEVAALWDASNLTLAATDKITVSSAIDVDALAPSLNRKLTLTAKNIDINSAITNSAGTLVFDFGNAAGGTLNVNSGITVNRLQVQGNTGNDVLNVNAKVKATLEGNPDSFIALGNGDDSVAIGDGAGVGNILIAMQGGNDALTAGALGDTFFVKDLTNGGVTSDEGEWYDDADGQQTTLKAKWEGVENLTGAAGADTFIFDISGKLTGTVDGAGGVTDPKDTLVGDNNGNQFAVTSAGGGTLTGKTSGWSNIENLKGGDSDDSFTFSASAGSINGNLVGGAGNDTANVWGGTVVVGTGGLMTYESSPAPSAVKGTTTEVENIIGSGSNLRFDVQVTDLLITGVDKVKSILNTKLELGSYSNVALSNSDDKVTFQNAGKLTGALDGRDGNDTLVGDDNGNLFEVTNDRMGTLTETDTLKTAKTSGWSNIENVKGGTGADTVTFADAGKLSGTVDGAGGVTDPKDTLVGDDDGNEFGVAGANSGSLAGKTSGWSNIENVTGGAGTDTVTFANAGSLTGAVDGAGGTTDKIVGDDDGNQFVVTTAEAGTLTGKTSGWSNVENLTGGIGDDTVTFVKDGSLTGAVDGAAGSNTLEGERIHDATITANQKGSVKGVVTEFNGIQVLKGANATGGALTSSDVTVSGGDSGTSKGITWSGFQNLLGTASDDTFTFKEGGSLTGKVDGGDGTDTINGSERIADATITGGQTGTVSGADGKSVLGKDGFSNIETLIGNDTGILTLDWKSAVDTVTNTLVEITGYHMGAVGEYDKETRKLIDPINFQQFATLNETTTAKGVTNISFEKNLGTEGDKSIIAIDITNKGAQRDVIFWGKDNVDKLAVPQQPTVDCSNAQGLMNCSTAKDGEGNVIAPQGPAFSEVGSDYLPKTVNLNIMQANQVLVIISELLDEAIFNPALQIFGVECSGVRLPPDQEEGEGCGEVGLTLR